MRHDAFRPKGFPQRLIKVIFSIEKSTFEDFAERTEMTILYGNRD